MALCYGYVGLPSNDSPLLGRDPPVLDLCGNTTFGELTQYERPSAGIRMTVLAMARSIVQKILEPGHSVNLLTELPTLIPYTSV
jgi:hypothetical protein